MEAARPAESHTDRSAHARRAAAVARRARPAASLSEIMMLALALLVLQTSTDSLATHVRQVSDSYLVAYFERHPDEATLDGVANAPHDRLPDNSPAASARWWRRENAWLAELARIDPAPL